MRWLHLDVEWTHWVTLAAFVIAVTATLFGGLAELVQSARRTQQATPVPHGPRRRGHRGAGPRSGARAA